MAIAGPERGRDDLAAVDERAGAEPDHGNLGAVGGQGLGRRVRHLSMSGVRGLELDDRGCVRYRTADVLVTRTASLAALMISGDSA
jgi:hypothetical protein